MRMLKKYFPPILLLLFFIIPSLDLFHPGLPLTHDGQDHVTRIANFYQNLEEGNLIPRWAANLNWGYGHPILMFLYPIPSYTASFFHFLGFSFVDSIKIVFGLALASSGLAMYLWTKESFGKLAGFLAGVLYVFTPYRFVDLYVRGAIGEHVAFVFPPLIFYFLLKLSKKYSIWYVVLGALSVAGLVLSHNAISLMFLPLILFYAFYLVYLSKFKKNLIFSICHMIVLGFGLAAFFWMPAFFEGKYTLRNIVTKGEYLNRFVEPLSFLYGPWSYEGSGRFSVQIGIVNIIAFTTSFLFLIFKKKDKLYIFIGGIVLYSLFVIFLMISSSNFIWQRFLMLQNFQFPWRFLSVLVFTTSAMAALMLVTIPKKFKFIIFLLLIAGIFYFNKDYWHAKEYLYRPESFYTSIYDGTTDTGESAPVWSVRFMEKQPKAKIEVIDGQASIKEIKRVSTKHIYEVNVEKTARIRENTLYFPGWTVLVDNKPVDVEFQDQKNRGLITFYVPGGQHSIDVLFEKTKLRKLSDIISLVSILYLVAQLLTRSIKKRSK